MISSNKVVWFEGMFLQPQHFQQHDRYIESMIHHKYQCIDNNFWGFTKLEINEDLSTIGKLGLKQA